MIEDALAGVAAGKTADIRVVANPDRRFVDPASMKDKPIAFSTIFRQLRRSFAGAGRERINQNSELDHWEAACVTLSECFSIKRSRREFLVDVFSQ